MMYRSALVAVMVLAAAGCVERRMTLVTEPAGALAYYNGEKVGVTPVTFHFTYYQPPDLRFEKDGYQTLKVTPTVPPPFYELAPLDFFSEAVLPFNICDRRTFTYTLEKKNDTTAEGLLKRADELRSETLAAPAAP